MTPPPEPDDPSDDQLADTLSASRALEDPPEALIRRAIDIYQPKHRTITSPSGPGLLRRLVAVLSFDSAAPDPAVAGLRAAPGGPGAPRQMLYTIEGHEVDLRIGAAADGRHWEITGQVLGPESQGWVALRCGAMSAERAWGELADFLFEAVPSGTCCLTLRTAAWTAELPPLSLGAAADGR